MLLQIDRAGNKTLFAKNLKSPRNIAFHKLPIGYAVLVLDSNRMVIYHTSGNLIGTETISGIQQIQDCAYDSIAQVLYFLGIRTPGTTFVVVTSHIK